MISQVYEVDDYGFILEIHVAKVDDRGNILDESMDGLISKTVPNGLYKPRWNGTKWTEGATAEEIAELTKPQPHVPTDSEILGQQMTERELEAIVQGQQITDMDLRLFMVEMGAGQ